MVKWNLRTSFFNFPLEVEPLSKMDYIAIEAVFYPLYLHSRFFGCNLFYLPKSSKTVTIAIRVTDILILIIYVGLYVWMFVSVIYSQSESDQILRDVLFHLTAKTGSLVMAFVGRILFHIFAATNIFINIMDVINRNRIWKILCELRDFDDRVCIRSDDLAKFLYLSQPWIIFNQFLL